MEKLGIEFKSPELEPFKENDGHRGGQQASVDLEEKGRSPLSHRYDAQGMFPINEFFGSETFWGLFQ